MRQIYRLLANLVALTVVVQVASIAMAWFLVIHDTDEGKVFAGEDDLNIGHWIHSIGAIVIALLALALLIVSFFAHVSGGVKWAALVVLAVVVQWVLAILSFSLPVLGALHGINALVIAGVASVAARRSLTSKPSEPSEPVAA